MLQIILNGAPFRTESEAVRSSAGDERGSEGNSDGDATADAPVSGASVSSSPPNESKVSTVSGRMALCERYFLEISTIYCSG